MYAVDQLKNPDSIVFQPGGLFSPQFLIAGNIGTVYKDAVSVQLYRDFCRALRRGFTTYNRLYSVGPEAVKLARDGTRLITMHVNEDKEYDLKIEVPRL
jgi:hypothetical protein